MIYIILLFGILMILAGIAILIDPQLVFGPMHRNMNSSVMHFLAVAVRVILGALLVVLADQSRYPTVILILGWFSIAAAAILMLIGRRNFVKLISWALGFTKSFGRISGLLVVSFGVFLVYAFA